MTEGIDNYRWDNEPDPFRTHASPAPVGMGDIEKLLDIYGNTERRVKAKMQSSRAEFQDALDRRDAARTALLSAVATKDTRITELERQLAELKSAEDDARRLHLEKMNYVETFIGIVTGLDLPSETRPETLLDALRSRLAEALRQRDEATARSEKAEARIAELEDALRPFAAYAGIGIYGPDDRSIVANHSFEAGMNHITAGDFRRAARTMGATRHE